eukprot:CAMPEP_0118938660 /NCGR_PEP_ID=MMETSP1169-20130426/26686_1 /TAXON_ID=36882 /ORGANISM="Pyramimonas obovata, Strain CCMP722" /LENGTH=56 /DNA_ID=CAMNT_0006882671 /DNA_START=57 /DNA_END=224 /DNA_ORIENTATION=+
MDFCLSMGKLTSRVRIGHAFCPFWSVSTPLSSSSPVARSAAFFSASARMYSTLPGR